MAALEEIEGIQEFLKERIDKKWTYEKISEELRRKFPYLSERSVRRFCATNDIQKTSRLSEDELTRVVSSNISKVSLKSKYIHKSPLNTVTKCYSA